MGIWSVHRPFDGWSLVVSVLPCRLDGKASPGARDSSPVTLRTQIMFADLFDSPWKILIVAIVIIVLFGSRKLPAAARSLGQSMRILKTEVQGLHEDNETQTTHAAPAQAAAPAQLAPTAAPVDHQAQIDALNAQRANLQQNAAGNKATDNVQAQ